MIAYLWLTFAAAAGVGSLVITYKEWNNGR